MRCPECGSDDIEIIDEFMAECRDCHNEWEYENDSPFGSTDDQISGLGGYDDSLGDDL